MAEKRPPLVTAAQVASTLEAARLRYALAMGSGYVDAAREEGRFVARLTHHHGQAARYEREQAALLPTLTN